SVTLRGGRLLLAEKTPDVQECEGHKSQAVESSRPPAPRPNWTCWNTVAASFRFLYLRSWQIVLDEHDAAMRNRHVAFIIEFYEAELILCVDQILLEMAGRLTLYLGVAHVDLSGPATRQ